MERRVWPVAGTAAVCDGTSCRMDGVFLDGRRDVDIRRW